MSDENEEIRKILRELFEDGFLTEEEFNSKISELDVLGDIPPSKTDDIESEKIQSESPSLKEAELEIELAEAELAKKREEYEKSQEDVRKAQKAEKERLRAEEAERKQIEADRAELERLRAEEAERKQIEADRAELERLRAEEARAKAEEDLEPPPHESAKVTVEKPTGSPEMEGADVQSAVEGLELTAEEKTGDGSASGSADPKPVSENLTEEAAHTKVGKRERLFGAVVGSALAVLVGVVLITATGDDAESVSQIEAFESGNNNDLGATTTTTTTTITTTTPPPVPPTDDLLQIAGTDASADEVKTAQRFLADLGYPAVPSGSWGSDTEKAILELRSNYGLGAGGFDQDLWQKVLTSKPPEDSLLSQRESDVEGIMIPAGAVYIGGVEDESFVTSGARYMLPYFQDDTMEVSQWYQSRYMAENHDSWRWCRQTTEGSDRLRFYWWQEPDRMLVVLVREMGQGRVDILIAVGEGASPRNCFGHFTSTTTTTSAPSYRDPTIEVTCPATWRSDTFSARVTFGLAVDWDRRAGFRSLQIDYGDGAPISLKKSEDYLGESFTHTYPLADRGYPAYPANGSYGVKVTITDGTGQKASDFCVWRWYYNPTTTTTTTKAPVQSSSGSSSGGSVCWVGMNFEDCQDAMGVFGQIPYIDCEGNRNVWWSSNWWIIRFVGSTPVVSKERSYCS